MEEDLRWLQIRGKCDWVGILVKAVGLLNEVRYRGRFFFEGFSGTALYELDRFYVFRIQKVTLKAMFEIGKTKRDAYYFVIGVLFLKLHSLYFSRTAFGRIFELLHMLTNSALGCR